jgi:hypothetical protein
MTATGKYRLERSTNINLRVSPSLLAAITEAFRQDGANSVGDWLRDLAGRELAKAGRADYSPPFPSKTPGRWTSDGITNSEPKASVAH